jgi:carbamoyl-phosphate synthase large subunit
MKGSADGDARRVLLLGSGGLQIGQAGEFDYAGSQACKALREAGIYTVLLNPNIATVQTSAELADAIYFLPVEPRFAEEIIERERINAIFLSFGGQSALTCGLLLDEANVLARRGVSVLGTSIESIRTCEDRRRFAEALRHIDIPVPTSRAVTSIDEAEAAAVEIGFPLMLRAGYSLGGRGSAIVRSVKALRPALERAFAGGPSLSPILVEECLAGWKEIEYEILRDDKDHVIAVCNMENVDPMGVHTGESIVVAPSQTLCDEEYQRLREVAFAVVRHLGIVGECNIQFALDPRSAQFRVIEVNPRLSRSSALASKATGYPLAYVAARLALGHTLPSLKNAVTMTTPAFFEPALDYVVCKVPRWDLDKFRGAEPTIGTEMKSIGEVMAIGRSFGEALQKALRMLEVGADGFDDALLPDCDLAATRAEVKTPSPRRIFALARAFVLGMSVDELAELTAIDRFFLHELEALAGARQALRTAASRDGLTVETIDRKTLLRLKCDGFSDAALARLLGGSEGALFARRKALGIVPRLRQIDTLGGEYPAATNYLYFTYAAVEDDVAPAPGRKLLVLGSGCYRIGSSVEFDWSCVSAVRAARALGYKTTLLNCNPETVSTDYDTCDRLIFDEVSLELVRELFDFEAAGGDGFFGVVVSMGGQTPNRLALPLHRAGIPLIGTRAESIDRAEDRAKFSALCDALQIDQPAWAEATRLADLDAEVARLGGFPVLVRPSYVLSGAAMRVAHSPAELHRYLRGAAHVSPEHPVVITRFERHARELDIDAVAQGGEIILWAACEHIEDAGVHSGDATLVLPPEGLEPAQLARARKLTAQLGRALSVTGPFNVQLLLRGDEIKVIECNLRASRSLPLVSKALGCDFADAATRVMLEPSEPLRKPPVDPLRPGHVVVKAPMFSFRRLAGADPILGVEMAATGEVAAFGRSRDEALCKALLAAGFRFPRRGVLLSLGPPSEKRLFADEARALFRHGLPLFATVGTAELLRELALPCIVVDKGVDEGEAPQSSLLAHLRRGDIDLIINVPRSFDESGRPDGFLIRRAAVDLDIPLLTDLSLARAVVRVIERSTLEALAVLPWHHYITPPSRS